MNSFNVGIKKFFANKNTVTVVGVALAILVLYFGYEWRVKSSINPVTVPYALKTISPGTQITDDLIGTVEVPPAMLKGDAYTRKSDVVDMYAAIDLVSDKLERQIRKNKTRLNRNVKDNIKEFNFDFDIKEEEEPKEKIVKRKDIEMKPMDEEEAILEMELLGHSFFVYKDMDTNKICVLYKRKDGDYGLIETK